MKVLFTLLIGICLGWLNAQWDVKGQLALEQRQLELERDAIFKATVGEMEEKLELPESLLRLW
ncbi:hypothetical protein [Rufibacter roseus]|uniref:Uncharacterized protein n=1 Tax=Rufibacter roseus TaxID=1567108 RepID=A0ABW2DSV8_9BACT|nr:hypothetical protein [Rufibacter roseus]